MPILLKDLQSQSLGPHKIAINADETLKLRSQVALKTIHMEKVINKSKF